MVGFVEVLAPIACLLEAGRSFARGAVRVVWLVVGGGWSWSGSGRRLLIGVRLGFLVSDPAGWRLGGDGGLCCGGRIVELSRGCCACCRVKAPIGLDCAPVVSSLRCGLRRSRCCCWFAAACWSDCIRTRRCSVCPCSWIVVARDVRSMVLSGLKRWRRRPVGFSWFWCFAVAC